MKIGTNCKQILIYIFLPAWFLAAGALSGVAYERFMHREECLKTAYEDSGAPDLSDREIGDLLQTLNSGEEGNSSSIDQSDQLYASKPDEPAAPEKQNFVGSKNSNKFYPADCRYAKLIKDGNKVYFSSREEGEKQGRTYMECK